MRSPLESLVELDLQKIIDGELSQEQYLDSYWYSLGSWNGGQLLTLGKIEELLQEQIQSIDFSHRAKIQEEYDEKLDPDTKKLVQILRLMALWRDERKVYLQMQ